jgi:hypothetical protein
MSYVFDDQGADGGGLGGDLADLPDPGPGEDEDAARVNRAYAAAPGPAPGPGAAGRTGRRKPVPPGRMSAGRWLIGPRRLPGRGTIFGSWG